MVDKDTELLSRVITNHLFLGQFEPFRATLLTLRSRNPNLARSILQTIVSKGGRLDNLLFSFSCPSPAHLTHLCTLELLQFNDPCVSVWSFGVDSLRLRAEFSLCVQIITSRVVDCVKESVSLGESVEIEGEDRILAGNSEFGEGLRVLERVLEVGASRLRPSVVDEGDEVVGVEFEEEEFGCLKKVVLENAEMFEALCENVEKQVGLVESEDMGLGRKVDADIKVFRMIQRVVQEAHLDAMSECLKDGDEDGVIGHIRFLHLDYGVEESRYRMVLQDLVKRVLLKKDEYGDTWLAIRRKLLSVYAEALSSTCTRLVQMIQIIQDDLLAEEIEIYRASGSNQMLPPLERLRNYISEPTAETGDSTSSLKMATYSCMRDLYHYARVSGVHVLESVMNIALSAVKREQLQEASDVLSLFPRLQPLVVVMGWDLLSGKTKLRKKLMQLLWTTKSQVLQLEESSQYGNSHEVSCVEHLCDFLCYQLDLATFVACVNSGQSWSLKSSLLLSRRELPRCEVEDYDPFVENLVLERLSVGSPIRVLFDVVPSVKYQDAIELISMQPITSNLAAWNRMQDVELMHMRYALESTVSALEVMGRNVADVKESYQVAVCYLKDLRNHLEAISNIPRKILMINIIISLLHMDDLKATPLGASHSELPDASTVDFGEAETHGEGNEMVVSFTNLLLKILQQNLPLGVPEQESSFNAHVSADQRQALEWRSIHAKRFIEDWEWRLSILQCLLPLSERQWSWKEALTVLRAAPSKLLNL